MFLQNKSYNLQGHLGGSVNWTSDSHFQLRLCSQGHETESHIRLLTEWGVCFPYLSTSVPPLNPACTLSLILSLK